MACIKSAARSALVAFAPDAPYLAAGTMAGAVDLSFSSSANLEIFELDFQSDSSELPLVGSCPSTERFNRLAWGRPVPDSDEFPLGLVAGGLGDGSISVWNPHKLIRKSAACSAEDQDVAFVARLEKHTGPVRGLDFNPHSSLLASGADEGELCIWDLANPLEPIIFPSLKSSGSGAQTEVSFVAWNPKFQHILASTSYNGITVVWDLKQQKPVTRLSDSNKTRCSVLQWNPDISTQFIVASDDDSSPALKVWDVRKTISPLREFVGHTKGVISMSWCPYDGTYLLTCAKDNRTICWDTTRGEIVCELPAGTNWNFDIHWYPRIPGVISASSFDVKVGIYNLEACNRVVEGEFGAPARLKAPKWLKRPVGTSFGFGGKLVSFQSIPSVQSTGSEVYVHNLVTEHGLVSRSTEFEAAIQDGEKASLRVLCDKKSQDSVSEDDKETWGFLKVMFEEEGTARTKLLTHLGFSVPNEGSEGTLDELGQKLSKTMALDGKALYEGGDASAFAIDNGEDFFNNLQPSDDNIVIEDSIVPNNEQIKKEAEEHSESSDSSIDERIQRALVVGDYNEAVLQCISANRMADALVIAHVGGPSLWETTRDQYLKNSLSPYLKVVSAMVSNDLMRLVNTRPLKLWKETLALLCTFAQKEEWTVLCDTLASRLMTGGNTLAATLCYISAGNIDRTVEIWSHSLSSEYEGRSYVDLLQDLMEKTIVLALATGQKRFSTSLTKLVENYAELLASQGLLTTAMEYLKLLGSEESSHELAILSDRIAFSAAEKEISRSLPYENSTPQPAYGADVPSFGAVDSPQDYYKEKVQPQPLQNISGGSYGESYLQPMSYYGGYQPVQQHVQVKPQFPEYMNPAQYQSAQPPAMFVPSQTHQAPQQNFAPPPGPAQPTHRSFTPATPQTLRNAEQYQQPSLGTQLYPGGGNQTYQPGPSVTPHHGFSASPGGPVMDQFPQPMVPAQAPKGFLPANPGSVQRPGTSPAQPSSPTQPAQLQTTAPLPTVQTVDTSNVSVALRPVITTLTRLFHETSEALGGSRANPSKKREIEDNSRKIGALFFKLNSGDISPNAASKLGQLCQALDSGDFAGALHIQVVLTTSDWDECNFWLAALKRMIKARQSIRI